VLTVVSFVPCSLTTPGVIATAQNPGDTAALAQWIGVFTASLYYY
jgi:flavin reductase (DIM6/NTAB) family NADH-FMN oxidoreductase RutF